MQRDRDFDSDNEPAGELFMTSFFDCKWWFPVKAIEEREGA